MVECLALGICVDLMIIMTLANICRAPTVCQAWCSVLYKATQLARGEA